jgi:hypothetical protein
VFSIARARALPYGFARFAAASKETSDATYPVRFPTPWHSIESCKPFVVAIIGKPCPSSDAAADPVGEGRPVRVARTDVH